MNGRLMPGGGFYEGRRVLVTGHRGFKGSWLSRWLTLLGAEVRGFGRAAEAGPEGGGSVTAYRSGDIRDAEALRELMVWARPEVVFHLAAQANVLRSYRDPASTFEINVMGTVRLIEACAAVDSVRAVIVVTSDKCYAENDRAHVESDPLGGTDPYSASKAAAELAVAAWRSDPRGPSIATVRAGNVIGGGDWAEDRIVVDLARAAQEGRSAVLRRPNAVRPWQHVLEPLAGYLELAARLDREGDPFARAWNFGPDPRTARTVADLATEFAARWSAHSGRTAPPPVVIAEPGPPERLSLTLDSGAAADRLGWRTVLSFEDAVDMTAQWYARSAVSPAFDGGHLMVEQIGRYQERAARAGAAPALA
jgi:CDP-glucose 4,6-dehydratase